MYDVVSVGTLSIDLYFKSECLTCNNERFELALGGKYFTDQFYESLGGGATNVAIGLQKHGLRTSLITVIGENSFKPVITAKLHEAGVSYFHSQMVKEFLNISSILLSSTGEKTVINYQSPHQHLFENKKQYEALLRASTVYFGNTPGISFYDKLKILSYLRENKRRLILNMGVVDCRRPKEQVEKLLADLDILIVNGHEFADIVKKPYETLNFRENVVVQHLPLLRSKICVITDGEKGSFAYDEHGRTYHQPAIKPAQILDSTGAGDGYTAGFIAEYLKKGDIQKAMHAGALYSTKILERIGAN